MKIIAAIMDISILKFWRYKDKVWFDSRMTKKFLVYDPSKVTGWDLRKEKEDATHNSY